MRVTVDVKSENEVRVRDDDENKGGGCRLHVIMYGMAVTVTAQTRTVFLTVFGLTFTGTSLVPVLVL